MVETMRPLDDNQPIPEPLGEKELRIIYDFTAKVVREFKTFIKSVVIFGSFARGEITLKGDIDIMIIVDDGQLDLNGDIKRFYDVELKKIIESEHSPLKIHTNTVPLSEFWDGIRVAEPILLNIVREGLPIFDRGFFMPVKKLLESGRIKPTTESVYLSLDNADVHLIRSIDFTLKSVSELYWATIDGAHAALMEVLHVPVDPKDAGNQLNEKLVKKNLIPDSCAKHMDHMYTLMKQIGRGEVTDVSGKEVEILRNDTEEFVKVVKQFVIDCEKERLAPKK